MNFGFWQQLPRPVLVLAPMAGVTDAAYRALIARLGKPMVMWTEFVPADALVSRGCQRVIHDLWKSEAEKPILAQIYGSRPEGFRGAAQMVAELGFDGLDINMGCPSRAVEKHCAGAALIRKPQLAAELIAAAKDGAGDLPVSVKTRIGYNQSELESWLPLLIGAEPAAITIHARTRKDMSRVAAKWDAVAQAVEMARQLRPDPATRPLILGNGDVADLAEARLRASETGCDGVMIGRGVFGNPWLFSERPREDLPLNEILQAMLDHTNLYEQLFTGRKSPELLKKHFKSYLLGIEHTSGLRKRLMDSEGCAGIRALLEAAMRDGPREAAAADIAARAAAKAAAEAAAAAIAEAEELAESSENAVAVLQP